MSPISRAAFDAAPGDSRPESILGFLSRHSDSAYRFDELVQGLGRRDFPDDIGMLEVVLELTNLVKQDLVKYGLVQTELTVDLYFAANLVRQAQEVL